MRAPGRASWIVLVALVLSPCDSYRAQRHMQQPSAVYDVEVHEVDAATLRQILAGQQRQQQVQQPQGQWGRPASNPATNTRAHFVSPSGQVYTLKNMNGVSVLVGPDGRWYPLNGNNNFNVPNNNFNAPNNGFNVPNNGFNVPNNGFNVPDRENNNNLNVPDQSNNYNNFNRPLDFPKDHQTSTPRSSGRRPPGPSGPNYEDDDIGSSMYDRNGGGGPKGVRDAEDCVASKTTFNGGRRACRYQLLLDEQFELLNLTLWKHDVLVPNEPDFEFVAYDKDPDNSYVDQGTLHIKPTLLEDTYGPGFVLNGTLNLDGCTSTVREHCTRSASTYRVLPSVRSARLTTRDTFTFRYGIVEVRVLVPEGDWIYPAITLDPASSMYGKWYAGGQIRLPHALGNRFLEKTVNGPKAGLQVMRAGVALGKTPGADIQPTVIEKELEATAGSDWRQKHFRVYRVKWTPEYIEFSLDGNSMGKIWPPAGGFVSMTDSPRDHPWRLGTKMAPFDQEFFISLGVGVGGVNRFPDGMANGEYNEHPKPWKNSSPKALLDFYKALDHWLPTWSHPAMEVTHVKVWAL